VAKNLPEYFSKRFANHFDGKELQNFVADIERQIKDDIPEIFAHVKALSKLVRSLQ
jgi:hypothetical protein